MIRTCDNDELSKDNGIYILLKHDPLTDSACFLDPVIISIENEGRTVNIYEGSTSFKSKKSAISYSLGVGDYICRIAYSKPPYINEIVKHLIQFNHMTNLTVEVVDPAIKSEVHKMIRRATKVRGI